ncbi:carbon-nitrogen family hydrolase [Nitriliruptoria bacterium AS10]|nr:nitrilase-related carbon-nitrogen hydrolase [Salsipaludibacter albus]MBY5162793.1 carbon-nitrogen family hydrolase [Salsipaludibacter albus]
MTVVGVQADLAWEDRDANLAMFDREVDRAAAIGADLVVLPEMFPSGFSMATDVTAEPAEGPSATFLVERAAATGAWLVGSFACADGGDDGRPTNRLLLAGPDGTVHHYDKVHPFSHAGEDQHFAPGRATRIVDVAGVRVAPFVCYDLRFANVFWSLGPDVDLFVVPANWPSPRRAHWRTLLRARAIENQAWVVGLNRVGVGRTIDGRDLEYSGDSMVVDPLGEVVASAAGQPTLLVATVDTDRVAEVRDRFRFLPDRRFSADLS